MTGETDLDMVYKRYVVTTKLPGRMPPGQVLKSCMGGGPGAGFLKRYISEYSP